MNSGHGSRCRCAPAPRAGVQSGRFSPVYRLRGSGRVGALPAVMIAIMNALAPLGVTDLDMPASPERVWRAIQAARAA